MSQNLKTLFTGKVTVVGDVMLDSYWKGPSSRISPEAPVPVVKVQDKEERAGGAANVAINIASLGAPCNLVGIVGEDKNAEILEKIVRNQIKSYDELEEELNKFLNESPGDDEYEDEAPKKKKKVSSGDKPKKKKKYHSDI